RAGAAALRSSRGGVPAIVEIAWYAKIRVGCAPSVEAGRAARRQEGDPMSGTLTGGCLCGRVRFEVTQPLVMAGYCHCTRCQRRTGTAAAVSARIAPGSLRILSG